MVILGRQHSTFQNTFISHCFHWPLHNRMPIICHWPPSNTAHFTFPLLIQNWLPKSLPHLHGPNSPDCFPFLHTSSSTPLKWFKCFQSSHDQNKTIKSITLQTTKPVAMSSFLGMVNHNENQDALFSSKKKVTVTFTSKKLRVTKSLGQNLT